MYICVPDMIDESHVGDAEITMYLQKRAIEASTKILRFFGKANKFVMYILDWPKLGHI